MNDNLFSLINTSINMTNQLALQLNITYEKTKIRFVFSKGKYSNSIVFSMIEIEFIADIKLIENRIIENVYELIDAWRENK